MDYGKLAKKFAVYAVIGIVAAGLVYNYVFSDSGFLKRREARKRIKFLESELLKVQEENQQLRSEIQNLGSDLKTIEKAARDLGMVKPGEKIIKFVDEEKPDTSQAE